MHMNMDQSGEDVGNITTGNTNLITGYCSLCIILVQFASRGQCHQPGSPKTKLLVWEQLVCITRFWPLGTNGIQLQERTRENVLWTSPHHIQIMAYSSFRFHLMYVFMVLAIMQDTGIHSTKCIKRNTQHWTSVGQMKTHTGTDNMRYKPY